MSCEPEILIADEPTSALDVTVQRTILDNLGRMTTELGTSTIFVTHDLGLAAERAENLVVMYKGRVVERGSSIEILRNPSHEYTKRLVAAAPSLVSVRLRDDEGADVEAAAHALDEREPILKIRDLKKTFRVRDNVTKKRVNFDAVAGVTFDVPQGSTVAIVGESGSGKSTIARMVLRLEDPTEGTIEFSGKNVASLSGVELKKTRKRLQPIFQDPYSSINPMVSIEDVLTEPMKVHGIGTKKEQRERAKELLDLVALPEDFLDRFASELSGGQRQRVVIARSLALDPEVIICDEPVSALDVLVQAQVLELLAKLQKDLGLSYLFISHDLAVVRLISDYVLVMRKGEIVEQGTAVELFDNPQHEYTRTLINSIPGKDLV